jgi:hypothetical protein
MGYVDQMKESRSGSTRASQGTDPEAINKNVGGLLAMQNASKARTDMIARLFAETGLRDLYKKCVKLYQKNLKQPFTVKVDGTDVTVSPQQIQGRIKCKSNMGIELQLGMAEAERLKEMVSFLGQLNQLFPGIITPQHIHKIAVDFVANLGKKQPDDYVAKLEEFVKSYTQNIQQAQQQQEREWKIKEEELRQGWAKIQVAAKKNEIDLTEIMKNFEGRMSTKILDIEQTQKSDQLDFITELLKLQGANKK